MYLVCKVSIELKLLTEHKQGGEQEEHRYTKCNHTDTGFGGLVKAKPCGQLCVVIHKTKRGKQDNGLDGIRHFLQKAFHRERNTLISSTVFIFTVVHNIRKEDSLRNEHGADTDGS